MTDINFLYWLRGFLEKDNIALTDIDIEVIKQHLALITSKEIQATVFIEGVLMGLDYCENIQVDLRRLLSTIVSGVIQEVADDKKDELVKAAKTHRAAGRGLSGGFCGGGLKIC